VDWPRLLWHGYEPRAVQESCSRAQVHFIWPNGRGALLAGVDRARPSYERLLSLLQSVPGSKASRSWVDRVNPFNRVSHHIIGACSQGSCLPPFQG
jgi:hypothetical protein